MTVGSESDRASIVELDAICVGDPPPGGLGEPPILPALFPPAIELPRAATLAAKIMIVDDVPLNVEAVRGCLADVGYRNFVTTSKSTEVVELVQRDQPDVILLDIMMPEVNGLQILAQLRATAQVAHIPVLILTVVDDRQTKLQALELGATDFLNKPVDSVELVPRVRNALVTKAHRDHLQDYARDLERRVSQRTRELEANAIAQEEANRSLKRLHSEAQAASRTKSEFLANVSHEIRTPMTAILGYADLLNDPELAKREKTSYVQTIQRNGQYLLDLINNILDLSKIEAGKIEVERTQCSLRQIVEDVVSLMRLPAATRGLSLEAEYESALPETIRTDPIRLRQILLNFVGNALKFTERGGVRISVRLTPASPGPPTIRIAVADTGIGMSRRTMERLFEPFHQADTSATRRFGGTGLGLAISKRLARLLEGDIEVQSTPGKGSTFTLTIVSGNPG